GNRSHVHMYNLDTGSPLTSPPSEIQPDLSELARRIDEEKCVVFAGAGISRKSDLPTWEQLMTRLVDFVKEEKQVDQGQIEEIKKLIERGDFITAAELLQRCFRKKDTILEK